MSTLQGDDGRPLEVKEGVVIDQKGHVLSTPDPTSEWDGARGAFRGRPKVHYFKLNPITGILFLLALPILFTAGLTIVAVMIALFFLIWILSRVFRLFL